MQKFPKYLCGLPLGETLAFNSVALRMAKTLAVLSAIGLKGTGLLYVLSAGTG